MAKLKPIEKLAEDVKSRDLVRFSVENCLNRITTEYTGYSQLVKGSKDRCNFSASPVSSSYSFFIKFSDFNLWEYLQAQEGSVEIGKIKSYEILGRAKTQKRKESSDV